MWEAYLLQFLWNLPRQNSFVSLFIEKLSVPHRFCFYAKILSLSFLLCFHRTSSGLTTIHFSFFSLSNKTLNLYEVSMYSAKVFHFSTTDDYWKIRKKILWSNFQEISEKGANLAHAPLPPDPPSSLCSIYDHLTFRMEVSYSIIYYLTFWREGTE